MCILLLRLPSHAKLCGPLVNQAGFRNYINCCEFAYFSISGFMANPIYIYLHFLTAPKIFKWKKNLETKIKRKLPCLNPGRPGMAL